MTSEVLVSRNGPAVTVALNRPDRLNALTTPMRAALSEALREAGEDRTCRVVILRGEGRAFCAGQDLTDLPDGTDLGQVLQQSYAPIVQAIRTMPKPVIAVVGGVAAGAGANLALACDFVLASESARFIQAFIHIGLLPDVGGTWLLPRLIGSARARAAAMLGDPITARQAETWGMIYRAVPDEQVEAEATTLAERLAALPAGALARTKHALDRAENHALEEQLDVEARLQRELGHSADFAEGRRAFVEKRAPRFGGTAA